MDNSNTYISKKDVLFLYICLLPAFIVGLFHTQFFAKSWGFTSYKAAFPYLLVFLAFLAFFVVFILLFIIFYLIFNKKTVSLFSKHARINTIQVLLIIMFVYLISFSIFMMLSHYIQLIINRLSANNELNLVSLFNFKSQESIQFYFTIFSLLLFILFQVFFFIFLLKNNTKSLKELFKNTKFLILIILYVSISIFLTFNIRYPDWIIIS